MAQGPIVLGNVTLGAFTVDGQALGTSRKEALKNALGIDAVIVTAPGSNASLAGFDQGLLGVGP